MPQQPLTELKKFWNRTNDRESIPYGADPEDYRRELIEENNLILHLVREVGRPTNKG
jgi:predicted P-loop ATPase